mgnify:CR=1 FL=1
MGRKQKIKQKRNAIKKCNITSYNLDNEGKKYKVQEYHPKNTEPMDYELFQKMRVIGFSPAEKISEVINKLVFHYPKNRFAIAVEENYDPKEHDVPIFSYPPLNELELKNLKGLMNSK